MKKLTLTALVSLLSIVTAGASGSAEGTKTIRGAVLKGPSAVGAVYLLEDPREEIQFQVIPSVDLMKGKILEGSLDFAVIPINLAAVLYNKGADYRLAAVTGNGIFHVVTTDKTVRTLSDLKGRTIHHIARGATPDIVFRYLLSKEGIDPETDLVLDYTYNQLEFLPQLMAGRLETGVLPEPFVSIARAKQPALNRVIDLQELWKTRTGTDLPATALLVRKGLETSSPELYRATMDAYRRSIEKALTDGDTTAELAARLIGFPQPVIRRVIGDLNLTFVPADQSRKNLEPLFEAFAAYDSRFIGGKIPDAAFYGQ